MTRFDANLADVGEGLDGAEIVSWLVEVGAHVERDETVVEVETAKSLVGIPAPYDGTLIERGGEPGDTVAVGSVLFVLETDADLDAPTPTAPCSVDRSGPDEHPAPAPSTAPVAAGRRPMASPATRQLALDHGIDLTQLHGSGPSGRITRDDVLRASTRPEPTLTAQADAAQAAPRAAADRVVPLRGLRREIAKTMTQAWRTVPHITDFREIDATNLVAARNRLREHMELDGVPFTYLPLLVKAVLATLDRFPVFNASIDLDAEEVTYHGRRNIGLATATPDGLVVPVLEDAGDFSLPALTRELHTLTTRARARQCSVTELTGGTFTITNFGSFGGWIATPIIRPPESGIAGFGRIRDQVVAENGLPVVRPVLPLSVSADHRLIDGDSMGGFLNHLTALLTDPILLMEGC